MPPHFGLIRWKVAPVNCHGYAAVCDDSPRDAGEKQLSENALIRLYSLRTKISMILITNS